MTTLCNECGKRGFMVCSGRDDCTHPRVCPSCAGQGSVRVLNTRGETLLYGCVRCCGGKVAPADARRPRCPQTLRIDGGPHHRCLWAEGHVGRHGFDPNPVVAARPEHPRAGFWSRDLVLANLRRAKRVGSGSFAEQITGSDEHRDALNAAHRDAPQVGGPHPTHCGRMYDSEITAFATALNELGVPAVLAEPCEKWQGGVSSNCDCADCRQVQIAWDQLVNGPYALPERVPVAPLAVPERPHSGHLCPGAKGPHASFFQATGAAARSYARPDGEP